MPLPFLQPKKVAALIVSKRGNHEMEMAPEMEAPGHEMNPALKAAAERLLRAIESKSVMEVAKAMEAGHEACESYDEPMKEGGQNAFDEKFFKERV